MFLGGSGEDVRVKVLIRELNHRGKISSLYGIPTSSNVSKGCVWTAGKYATVPRGRAKLAHCGFTVVDQVNRASGSGT